MSSLLLEKIFQLKKYQTTIRTEVIAGFTTFLTMGYIIFVNPAILSKSGIPIDSAFTATCIAAILGCFLVAFLANYPIAIAPGMTLNVYFTYTIVLTLGYTWQQALGAVFIGGIIFFLLTLFRIRQTIINAIPPCISIATAAGIGLFIGVVALKNAGIVIGNHNTLVQLGNMHSTPVVLCFCGFFLIAILDHYRIPGSIVISIITISIAALLLGKTSYHGLFTAPPSITPSFAAFQFDGLFSHTGLIVIFTFVMVALFDSSGTLMGVLHQVKHLEKTEEKKHLARALMADSLATMSGATLGTSTTSTFIESAAGVNAGGRTGLTALTVGIFFIFTLFLSPLAKMIPIFATAPALLFIACMMLKHMREIEWDDLSEAIPSAITMMMIPFTFSIANGIGLGFISYVVIKIFSGKFKALHPAMLLITLLFIIYFFINAAQ